MSDPKRYLNSLNQERADLLRSEFSASSLPPEQKKAFAIQLGIPMQNALPLSVEKTASTASTLPANSTLSVAQAGKTALLTKIVAASLTGGSLLVGGTVFLSSQYTPSEKNPHPLKPSASLVETNPKVEEKLKPQEEKAAPPLPTEPAVQNHQGPSLMQEAQPPSPPASFSPSLPILKANSGSSQKQYENQEIQIPSEPQILPIQKEVSPKLEKEEMLLLPEAKPRPPQEGSEAEPLRMDNLSTELELMAEANRLKYSAPQESLTLLEMHLHRFPSGRLAREREALRIDLLMRLGRKEEATKLAKAWLSREPDGPFSQKLRQILAE